MEARLILTIIKLKFHKLNVKIKFCVKTHFPTLETQFNPKSITLQGCKLAEQQ